MLINIRWWARPGPKVDELTDPARVKYHTAEIADPPPESERDLDSASNK